MQSREHFGNPTIEQRKLADGDALCLLPEHGIISVQGDDRLGWLHSLLSQNLKSLQSGESTEALLLDPQGHIEQIIKVIEDGNSTWLIVSAEKKNALLDWLQKMVFRMKVSVQDHSDQLALVGATKKLSGIAETSNSVELIWKDPWPGVSSGGYRYSTREVDYNWFEHLLDRAKLELLLEGKELAGTMAHEALRVAAGKPKDINEVDEKSLPHELDLLATAVHLTKGCYRGQETVAKVHNLGHPPRRLTFLHLDGSEHALPDVGDEVVVAGEEKVRGKITSVAQHYEMGPIALALLARSVSETAELEVRGKSGNIAATQEILVPASAGSVAEIPKLNRLNLSSRKI